MTKIRMTSERPLLVNNVASTEFTTTEQHAKELEAAGLAVRVGTADDEELPKEPAPTTSAKADKAVGSKAK